MSRLSEKQYQRHTLLAMAVYLGWMVLAWPLLRSATSLPVKLLLALGPVLPMLYMIGLMARRIRDSDELEQRTHLLALGAATALTAVSSLIGGFLAAAHVVHLDGTILIWVFPVLMIGYGATRWWVGRRYGMRLGCGDGGLPLYLRLWLLAVAFAAVALAGWRTMDEMGLGVLCGVAIGCGVLGTVLGAARLLARRHAHGEADTGRTGRPS